MDGGEKAGLITEEENYMTREKEFFDLHLNFFSCTDLPGPYAGE